MRFRTPNRLARPTPIPSLYVKKRQVRAPFASTPAASAFSAGAVCESMWALGRAILAVTDGQLQEVREFLKPRRELLVRSVLGVT